MTAGRITANLPSRDFEATGRFYAMLGFRIDFRNDSWMILSRDGMSVEFFPHPDLDPKKKLLLGLPAPAGDRQPAL
jgi:catechol 2,3-dioxygenase-like lactoylglutathione lyase family enzyme